MTIQNSYSISEMYKLKKNLPIKKKGGAKKQHIKMSTMKPFGDKTNYYKTEFLEGWDLK